ncbi:MAG TPA: type II toxin-antitoxin system VapC family toxin [Spirochaetia bacterium]|nr:type II toxin-antitoxin system VapC family toxin [Spirochaetia bacterium]
MVTEKYLIDSDWAIFYLRGKEPFVSALKEYRQQGLAISVVSIAELYEGIFRSPDPEGKEHALTSFLRGLSVIDVSAPVARLFGQRRAELRMKSFTVGDFDLLNKVSDGGNGNIKQPHQAKGVAVTTHVSVAHEYHDGAGMG